MPFLLKRKFTKSTKKPSVEVKSTSQTKSLAPLVDEPETRPTVAGATSVSAASSVALTPILTVETTKKRARRPLLANKAKKSVEAGASAKGRLKKQKIPSRNEINTGEKEKDDNNPEENRRGGRSDNVNNKGNKHELGEAVASENVEPKVQSTRGKGRRESKTNAKGTKTTSTSKAQTQTQTERKSPTKKKPKTLPKKKGRKKRKKRQDSDNEAYTSLSSPLASRSSLASMQPTRKSTRTRGVKLDYSAFLDQPQPLTLLPCEWYASADAQPFKLRVHSSAVFMMDVHAHLTDTEIIGLLAGEYDADSHVLTIYNAYPCRSLATDDDLVNVEMDPESEVAVSINISERGLSVVGWYHSHPHFQNNPSLVDVENQTRFQNFYKDAKAPYIGGIISPYDTNNGDVSSDIKWFLTRERERTEDHDIPMDLYFEKVHNTRVEKEVVERAIMLVEEYKDFPTKINFNGLSGFDQLLSVSSLITVPDAAAASAIEYINSSLCTEALPNIASSQSSSPPSSQSLSHPASPSSSSSTSSSKRQTYLQCFYISVLSHMSKKVPFHTRDTIARGLCEIIKTQWLSMDEDEELAENVDEESWKAEEKENKECVDLKQWSASFDYANQPAYPSQTAVVAGGLLVSGGSSAHVPRVDHTAMKSPKRTVSNQSNANKNSQSAKSTQRHLHTGTCDGNSPPLPTLDICNVCQQDQPDKHMICCDKCDQWQHSQCVGLTQENAEVLDTFACWQHDQSSSPPSSSPSPSLSAAVRTTTETTLASTVPSKSSKSSTTSLPSTLSSSSLQSPSPCPSSPPSKSVAMVTTIAVATASATERKTEMGALKKNRKEKPKPKTETKTKTKTKKKTNRTKKRMSKRTPQTSVFLMQEKVAGDDIMMSLADENDENESTESLTKL